MLVSGNYRRLTLDELPEVEARCGEGWKSADIPRRQWVSVVRGEIARYREGERMQHFDVLIRALKSIGANSSMSILDVGASSAFYSEVLKIGGIDMQYTALDFSPEYERLAHELFPSVPFKVADARSLSYGDNAFDVVLHGCCLIHIREYEQAIAEAARVAKSYVILNRTPVTIETSYFEKSAYGVPCLEIWFGEEELKGLFAKYGLEIIRAEDVFTDAETNFGHRTYTLKKHA